EVETERGEANTARPSRSDFQEVPTANTGHVHLPTPQVDIYIRDAGWASQTRVQLAPKGRTWGGLRRREPAAIPSCLSSGVGTDATPLACEPDVDLALNVRPLFGPAEPVDELLEARSGGWSELEPGQKVERLAEVSG